MKRKAFAISALAVSAALIAGAALAQQGLNIAIATGGTGGVYYPLGGGMANVLSKHVPGLIIGLGVLLWQARTPAPKRPALTT